MGKVWKMLIFLWAATVLGGCEQTQMQSPAVVTQVQILCSHAGVEIRRCYTQPEQMEAVLDCLRLQRSRGTASVDPERLQGDVYVIRVWLSDGQQHIYRHRAGRYLSKDSRPWQRVDPEQGQVLYELLWQFR